MLQNEGNELVFSVNITNSQESILKLNTFGSANLRKIISLTKLPNFGKLIQYSVKQQKHIFVGVIYYLNDNVHYKTPYFISVVYKAKTQLIQIKLLLKLYSALLC